MPTGRTVADEHPIPGGVADGTEDSERTDHAGGTNDDPGDGGSGWKPPSDAELELLVAGLPVVEIHPWGDHALAVMLREGARVGDLRTVLRFLPEDAALEGVYGDVEFAMAFEIPNGTES